jgi:RNA polymerase sigma-70 factor (ECF subfamily)
MGVMRTTQLVLPTCTIEVTPQPRTAPLQRLTPRAPETKRVVDGKTPKQAGEEWQLIESALEGDLDALSTLFARDRARLYRAVFSLLRNKEDAEDALQDGLLSAYVNLRSFKGRSQFSTWLMRIVLNAALMKLRKLRTLPQTSLDENVFGNAQPWIAWAIDTRPDPEQIYALAETKELVEKEMRQLSPVLRSAIQLRDAEHLSDPEVELTPCVNKNTFNSRLSRARRRLASQLATRGVELRNCCFYPICRSSPNREGSAAFKLERSNDDDRSGN